MRFLARSLVGALLTVLTLGLVALGLWRMQDAGEEAAGRGAGAGRPGASSERTYAVEVISVEPGRLRPELRAWGAIESARRLELRPARAGLLSELSPAFLDGGAVREGEVLFRIDPADARSDLRRAEIALDEAGTERDAAQAALALAARDLEAARDQRDLRASAAARQADLGRRGVGAAANAEVAELALAASEQQVIAREQAQAAAQARAAQAGIELSRAELARADAARALQETVLRAPFDGLVTEVAAVLGRRVNVNEKLGALVDLTRLEAAIRVTNAEFARLVDETGRLRPLPARVSLAQARGLGDPGEGAAVGASPRTREGGAFVTGRLARAGAATGAAGTGRTLYIRLDPEAGALMREGDFVSVALEEPALDRVASIPAAAATEDGRVLVVNADDRLEERQLRILRREGDALIVADAPWGARIVAIRKPQLGPGIKARIAASGPEARRAAERAGAPTAGLSGGRRDDAGAETEDDQVALTPERRAELTERVRADARLGEDDRGRLLDRLSAPFVPRRLVERLETGGPAASQADTDADAGAAGSEGG
ncbi:MAG: hypothetical protein CML46_12810 [Rhodobacteraceae bacterium]|nr:hypothetical protein [Paracoccaceae bacterium]